jgi:hypothetical protein
MPFAKGVSGNPAGPKPGHRRTENVKIDARKSAIHAIGPHAPALVELGVQRALAGNADALNGCLVLLSVLVGDGDKDSKQPPRTSPVDTNSPGLSAD